LAVSSSRRLPGWLAGIENVETMTPAALEQALVERGIKLDGPETVSVESLLPIYPESEDQWRTRRAATEVLIDPSIRFVRFEGLTLPEQGPDEADEPQHFVLDLPGALTVLQSLIQITTDDQLDRRLDEAADRGRVGLIVTELDRANDSSTVSARATLWVLRERAGWEPTASRQATERVVPVSNGTLPERVSLFQTSLLVLESFSGYAHQPDVTRASLDSGSTAERALARARVELDLDLQAIALPLPVLP
jgi:hypothetical protein